MDLCDLDRAALGHRIEDLRSAEVDRRRPDARRPADPRDQVPENSPDAAARHGGSRPRSAIWRVAGPVPKPIRCSSTRAVCRCATSRSKRLSTGWSAGQASHRRRGAARVCTICGTRSRCACCKAAPKIEAGRRHANMAALATYMGHVNIYATYWYLEATADLMRDVAVAGEAFFAEGRQS